MNKYIFISILLMLNFHFVKSQNQIGQNLNGEEAFDVYGYTTSISANGYQIAIGASRHDGAGVDYGHVKIYGYIGADWQQIGNTINGLHNYNELGNRVSLSASGNRVAISNSNYLETPSQLSNKSEVLVYEFDGVDWVQIGQSIRGKSQADLFGNAISISPDGSMLAIGADKRSSGATGLPYVQIYKYLSGTWVLIGQELEGTENSAFGGSVSLSQNGNILAVGIPNGNMVNVYQFDGSLWTILGQELVGENNSDFFGNSVSLSDTGYRLAVGAPSNDGNGNSAGNARVFDFINDSWEQIGSDIDGEGAEDVFGNSLSLSGNGNILAVGAYRNDDNGNNAGHTRIFNYSNNIWEQIGNNIEGEYAEDESGFSVSLSADGTKIIIGAPKNDALAENSGQVRVYDLNSTLSTQDILLEDDILIYPNPTQDRLFIQDKSIVDNLIVELIDVNGKIIKKLKLVNNTFDLSGLSSGIYYLKIKTNNNLVLKPIIKK